MTPPRPTTDPVLHPPRHQAISQRVERAIKRLTYGLLGKIMGTRPAAPIPLEQLSRILILRYDALGDMVLSTPIWRMLKAHKPGLVIGVAGSKKNIDLLRSDTDIDYLYTFAQKSNKGVWAEIQRAREIEWDVIVNLVYNDKSRAAIISWLIRPDAIRATVVRERAELYRNLYSILKSRPAQSSLTPIYVQTVQTLQAAVGITPTEEEYRPSLLLDSLILEEVSAHVKRLLLTSKTQRIVLLNTSSSVQYREWGYENGWEFSKRLVENHPDYSVFWTSAPEQAESVSQFFLTHQDTRIQYYATPTPQHLGSLVRKATIVVSPDTSVIHIASAERKPTVGLYIEKTEFLPFGVPSVVLHPEKGQPPATITVKSVLDAVESLLLLQEATHEEEQSEIHVQSKHIRCIKPIE